MECSNEGTDGLDDSTVSEESPLLRFSVFHCGKNDDF